MRIEQTAFDGGVGTALGTRATVRAGVRYSKADGHSVGPVNYGSRDSGGAYDTKDLSALHDRVACRRLEIHGHGHLQLLPLRRRVRGPRRRSAVLDVTRSSPARRTRLFPNGTRLVRLIDQAEFNRLVAAGALPAPGQFLASRVSSDFTFNSLTEFRRPAARYQGDFTWGSGQRLSVGYDWERETNPNVAGFDLDNNGFFVQQQIDHRRSLVRDGRRSRGQQGKLQHVRQPQAVGRRLPRAGAARSAVVLEAVRQHRPRREVADVYRAFRRRGIRGSQSRHRRRVGAVRRHRTRSDASTISGSARRPPTSTTTSPIRFRFAPARPATAFPNTSISTARRPPGGNWSSRCRSRCAA